MEDDAVIEALDRLKDWAMTRMLKSGEEPPAEMGEPEEEAEHEEEPEHGAELEIDLAPEEPKKSSVLGRYGFGDEESPKKPSMMPPMPKKRRRR